MKIYSKYRPFFLIELCRGWNRRETAKRILEEKWRKDGYVSIVQVTGGSMVPTFHPGSQVEVHYCYKPRARRGEVVFLRRGEERIVHRLVLTFGPFLVERGDANNYYGIHFVSSVIGTVNHVSAENCDTVN